MYSSSTSSQIPPHHTAMKIAILGLAFLSCLINVNGHGRFIEPPSRSSLYLFAASDETLIKYKNLIQPNFDDNGLNCGGLQTQIENGGKCGVCGDSYSAPVKENEAGGKYALGIITRKYQPGEKIDVKVEITAPHIGYFEFRLCPWNNVNEPITHECLNRYLLSFENGDTKWHLPEDNNLAKGIHEMKVSLPGDVNCKQCVIQWRYRAGNSWGTENGEQGLGLGQQEEFYGCSDVEIGDDSLNLVGSETSTKGSLLTTIAKIPAGTGFSKSATSATTATKENTSSSSEHPNVISPYPDFSCENVNIGTPVFRNCGSFFICTASYLGPVVFACPAGTVCDVRSGRCDHEYRVPYPCGSFQ
ncbi:uncharacterized protein LOC143470825 [Clavelina lepadiformis]|uniref:uncharacterized protein LOC143470825 n=1 Tax=Clavelina lepadiformis TaxID=159417 RepID=UPI00404211A5